MSKVEMRALSGLFPQPREVRCGAGTFALADEGVASFEGAEAEIRPALERVGRALGAGWRLCSGRGDAAVRFRLVPQVAGPQSYTLRVQASGVQAEAQDAAGLLYAAVTLAQIVRISERRLPSLQVSDAPDFLVRGVMLDISRDKVPTMETLYALVGQLSDLKLNQLQLYTEHTFAYREHEEVWRDASPMTAEEIRALDAYCRARCVELVPNQNSFGHLERWLTRPRYNVLAELPQGGAPLPWGGVHEKPTSLCPTDPRSVRFLEGLYDELLPNFSSRQFNVGCDETFDLRGEGRSAEQVRQVGEGRVYLEFLKRIQRLAGERSRTMQFWGDMIIRHPELVPEIPGGTVALEWGYEAEHPFEAHGELFAKAGVPFYVCPGTSSWNSLAGRTTNMRENIRAAADSGLRHGASGMLITDWGDGGHWQPLPVSYAGFAYGAGVAWCGASNRDADVAGAVDCIFSGGCGRALLELGDVYRLCGALRGNGTELFQVLSKPRSRPILAGVTPESLSRVLVRVVEIERSLPESRCVVAQEVFQVIAMLKAACHRGHALLAGGLAGGDVRRSLAEELDAVMAGHARVWRLRNREGGLADSLARFSSIRAEYD